jgi:hypothetical protein
MEPRTHASFIPQMWLPEIKRFLDTKFMMSTLLDRVPDKYKGGKEIIIPTVGRLRTQQLVPQNALQLDQPDSGDFRMSVNYRPWVAIGISDILTIQSDYDAMAEYSREAAYALIRDIDRWLLALRPAIKKAGNVVRAQTLVGGTPTDSPLNRAAILAAKLMMEMADVDLSETMWVFSPAQITSLLSINEFTSSDYVSGTPTETGQVGKLYGIPVYSTNSIVKNGLNSVNVNAQIIGASPLLVPSPGFAAVRGSDTIYSPWWPNPSLNGNPNGAGNHSDVTVTHSLAEGAYSGMLVKRGWAKYWQPVEPKVETERLVRYQSDALVTGYPLLDAKVYREEYCIIVESFESA